jgi:hypothetical protein
VAAKQNIVAQFLGLGLWESEQGFQLRGRNLNTLGTASDQCIEKIALAASSVFKFEKLQFSSTRTNA